MASVLNRLNIRTSHEEAWHDPLTHQPLDEPVPLRDGTYAREQLGGSRTLARMLGRYVYGLRAVSSSQVAAHGCRS